MNTGLTNKHYVSLFFKNFIFSHSQLILANSAFNYSEAYTDSVTFSQLSNQFYIAAFNSAGHFSS